MKNFSGGFAPIFIIYAVIVVMVVGGGYLAVKTKVLTPSKVETVQEKNVVPPVPEKKDITFSDQVTKNSISTCDSKNNLDEKNRCYEEIAIKNADVNICSKIATPSTFDHCVVGVAGVAKNVALCAKVKSDNTRNICYGSVATAIPNLSICNKIVEHPNPYGGVKDLCYANVARELKDVSICETISLAYDDQDVPKPANYQGGRVYCYQQVAKSLHDKTICEKIISTSERGKCVSGI